MTPEWKCDRRVGFLFPHACQRTTPVGCPDCQNGQIEDPYRSRRDRYYYDNYDYYDPGFFYLSTGATDFTEADGADLVQPDDSYETDTSAS